MLEPARPIRPPSVSLTFTSGLLMGGADAVPGVSGGTIALLLGLYERLIEATATVLRFPVLLRSAVGRERLAVSVRFLLPLLAGILVAYYLVTLLLVGPAERPGLLRRAESAPFCFAFFSGLVLMSLREPWRRIGKAGPRHGVALVLAAAAAAMLTGLPHAQGDVPLWAFLYGGALAVGVMLLPGVSGSLLLVVLGQYTIVAGAVHGGDVAVILVFLAGVALGLAVFVPLLRYLLRVHHDLTMACLTGFMAGSLRALWPWKSNYDPRLGPLENLWIGGGVAGVIAAAALGAFAAFGLAQLERRMRARPPAEDGKGP